MMGDRVDKEQSDARPGSPCADLVAKVADLENRLEDALRLKREVETQAEIIRVLTRRIEEEQARADQMAHPLRTFRHKQMYRTKVLLYRLRYWAKVLVYRQIYRVKVLVYRLVQSAAAVFKWRRRS